MFQGLDGFYWFTGVVEDRKDPDKRGRVRVRLHALHSKEKEVNNKTGQGIPTADLPWATVIRPITSAAMDGIGQTPLGLVEGSWVFGFARDGETYNDLLILGSIGGKPEDPPKDNNGRDGFVDPRSAGEIASSPRYINEVENRDPGYPPQGIPQGRYPQEKWLNEVDVNRLARAEKLDETLLKPKREKLVKRILTAFDTLWDEMDPPYGAVYPYNQVFESESGHVMEFDDTKDAERWHLWHKSKSYMEIGPEGKTQFKFMKDFFTVCEESTHSYAKKDMQLTAKKNFGIRAEEGDIKLKAAKGNIRAEADGEIYMLAKGNNSFHMVAEAGPLTITTETQGIAMTGMTGITSVATTGNISSAAIAGSIQGVASLGVSHTALAGNASMSSLGGNVSMNSAVGLADVTGLMGAGLNAIEGSVSVMAGEAINMLAQSQEISFISQLGTIAAIASAGMSLINQLTGSVNIESNSTNPFDSVSISSQTQMDISTTLGSIAMSTENPFGTGLTSPRSLELKSLEDNVSMSAVEGDVGISAFGEISLGAPIITIDSPTLNLIAETFDLNTTEAINFLAGTDLSFESGFASSITTGTNLNLNIGADLITNVTGDTEFNLDGEFTMSGTNVSFNPTGNLTLSPAGSLTLNSTSALAIDSDSTLDITTADDFGIDVTGTLTTNASGDISSTSVGSYNINGNIVSIDSAGDVSITSASGAIIEISGTDINVVSTSKITVTSPEINLAGTPPIGLDVYSLWLRDFFDTRYVLV